MIITYRNYKAILGETLQRKYRIMAARNRPIIFIDGILRFATPDEY